jgi:hypothetical protein
VVVLSKRIFYRFVSSKLLLFTFPAQLRAQVTRIPVLFWPLRLWKGLMHHAEPPIFEVKFCIV